MNLNYPQWYRVEKEAAIIINRISNYNDLSFYLNNSNHHIRKMAILRLGDLLPQEAINDLEQILNNPQEVLENKELSAWILQKISMEKEIDLFITNPLITKYSGEEELREKYSINLKDPFSSVNFTLSHSLLDKDLSVEEDYLLRNQETDFDVSFSFKEWSKIWRENLVENCSFFLKNLPSHLLKTLKIAAVLLWQHIISKFLNYIYNKSSQYYKSNRQHLNPIRILKNTGFFLLFILLFPVRCVRNNKFAAIGVSLSLFLFLFYSSQGQALIITYLGNDIWTMQNNATAFAKETLTSTWAEVSNVTSVWIRKFQASAAWQTAKEYLDLALSIKK